jgi:hypothetical protein
VPTDHGFLIIRSESATPFILRALKPQDGSNSSSLTSANVGLLISPQPEKRKVAGSIPALATRLFAQLRGYFFSVHEVILGDSDLKMGQI